MLVTGIQPPRVCAVNDSIGYRGESPAPRDLGALDPCDEHRDEEGRLAHPSTHPAWRPIFALTPAFPACRPAGSPSQRVPISRRCGRPRFSTRDNAS
ncbi:hypothetical protein CO655_17365 [Rhizobium sp. M1]|nr:hypothetical protein CO655_17365 [Rhizobium sp. M1]PDT38446.1 hypothetical protein CO671_03430 [Rhizobium sp. M10]